MKSYSVKSNAKRFARGIADKHQDMIAAVEPVEVSPGAREWFPAIEVPKEHNDAFREMMRETYSDVAVLTFEPCEAAETADIPSFLPKKPHHEPQEGSIDVRDFGARGSIFCGQPAEPLVFDAATIAARPELAQVSRTLTVTKDVAEDCVEYPISDFVPPEPVRAPEALTKKQSVGRFVRASNPKTVSVVVDYAKEAAELPPPVRSTPEEIAARRAERRSRIEAEKEAGTFGKKAERINKKKKIIDLISRNGGATQGELETATGWQRHTLRGYIAGTLRKQLKVVGRVIECIRGKGEEPTRYVVKMAETDGKGGDT
ncbi:DUF3489 domain-containing protein [Neorhizobium sp. T786]|uniref:DUF3489 domain-containing protein n=1 Tax=Pseudorhizobium xiangyangii TaxID=2883104 RepID=UPI001CFFC4BB|nr:DUF3489 domain-containing protein [Neorhizobium xiangyangii]MCB5201708.1 DUF3489 domain-containing protein [Neorhizobium xiangyangii]